MPKRVVGSIGSERALSRRIAYEREKRGWKQARLAARLTAAGCPMTQSAVSKIENDDPPRRITVDELVALANVFELDVRDLLLPVELIGRKQAILIARQLPGAFIAYDDAITKGLSLYLEYGRLAARSPELLKVMNSQAGAIWDRVDDSADTEGVDVGPLVTEQDIADFRREVVMLWGSALRLAAKAAGVAGGGSDGEHHEAI